MLFMTLMAWGMMVGFPLYGLRGSTGLLFCYSLLVLLFGLCVRGCGASLAQLLPHAPAYAGYVQFGLFLALAIAGLPIAAYCSHFIQISFDPFDWLTGSLCGAAAGTLTTYFFLTFSLVPFQGTPVQAQLEQTFVVRQFLHYEAVHALSDALLGMQERGTHGPATPDAK